MLNFSFFLHIWFYSLHIAVNIVRQSHVNVPYNRTSQGDLTFINYGGLLERLVINQFKFSTIKYPQLLKIFEKQENVENMFFSSNVGG